MQKTNIGYLTHTYNPIAMRCDRVSPGCLNCWHLRMAKRLTGNVLIAQNERKALAGTGPFVLREKELYAPAHLRKPAIIGVQFMGDVLHEDVPVNFIEEVLATITNCPHHTFLMLTKRAERLKLLTPDRLRITRIDTWPIKNLWPGVSICTQAEADEKIPILLKTPAAVRWISVEPILEDLNLSIAFEYFQPHSCMPAPINWLVLGAETGPRARPMKYEWALSIIEQCEAAGVPVWYKYGPGDDGYYGSAPVIMGKVWNQRPGQ